MIEISCKESKLLQHFFPDEEGLHQAFFDEKMGKAWVDDASNPTAIAICAGDFCYLAGDASRPQAKELLQYIQKHYDKEDIILLPMDEAWGTLAEGHFGIAAQKVKRYAMQPPKNGFDSALLQQYILYLPTGYTIRPIDESI
ncbi:GNAT family N-acetyltransferase [Clostridia bacterium OttesenSCG-928-F22]|nr:GNAT family N-acetyltransferase [Clostridia bacterium OttesenSCG-928-F22]